MPRHRPLPDYPWLVRRVRGLDGRELPRPRLWGKVYASSAESAVEKFVQTVRVNLTPAEFDAVPYTEER